MLLQGAYDLIFNYDIENKALVRSSYPIASFVGVYVLFAQWVGPAAMRHRKPFNLQKLIIVYNFTQMMLNMGIAYQLIKLGHNTWDERCMIQRSPIYLPTLQTVTILAWYTYLVKMLDCLDTVFFVLRKKNKQISFLHVFHHAFVCVLCHLYVRYLRFGYYLLIGVTINSVVHVIMYFYYALAAFGPSMQKYLWWKKYLTLLQMIQFSVFLAYLFVGLSTGCEEPGVEEVTIAVFVGLIFILFINFYRKSFKKNVE